MLEVVGSVSDCECSDFQFLPVCPCFNQGRSPVHHDYTPGPPERGSTVLSSADSHASGGRGECTCPYTCLQVFLGVPVDLGTTDIILDDRSSVVCRKCWLC